MYVSVCGVTYANQYASTFIESLTWFSCSIFTGRRKNWNSGSKQSLQIDLSHKSHNALDKYPTMHHCVTEMCTFVHISVTKWCIMGYLSNLMHCGICGFITIYFYNLSLFYYGQAPPGVPTSAATITTSFGSWYIYRSRTRRDVHSLRPSDAYMRRLTNHPWFR